MGLNNIWDLEDWEISNNVNEWSPEQAREKASKTLKKVQKIKKDEQRAKKDDIYLAHVLVDFLKNKKFDPLLPYIFSLIDLQVSSNIIVWIISLIYKPASDTIRKNFPIWKMVEFDYQINFNRQEFNEDNLDLKIRNRINEWIDDIYTIITLDPSYILTKRSSEILEKWEKKEIIKLISKIFIFFLNSLNFEISEKKALLYSDFIAWEIKNKLDKIVFEEENQI